MRRNQHKFLNAAIAKRRAHALHLLVCRAVQEASPSEVGKALGVREDAAKKCTDADTEFDLAFKLVTDPFMPDGQPREKIMTPDERSFIAAAIKRDIATHHYHQAARAARYVAEIDKPTAVQIRREASEAQIEAQIGYDKAQKLVTGPHLPK